MVTPGMLRMSKRLHFRQFLPLKGVIVPKPGRWVVWTHRFVNVINQEAVGV